MLEKELIIMHLFFPSFLSSLQIGILQSMPLQKKSRSNTHGHNRRNNSAETLSKYGPILPHESSIDPSLCQKVSRRPMGLTRSAGLSFNSLSKAESYFDLALRVGQLKLSKRFRNVRYLEGFRSKKSMYNLLEEQTLTNLHLKLAEHRQGQRIQRRTGTDLNEV